MHSLEKALERARESQRAKQTEAPTTPLAVRGPRIGSGSNGERIPTPPQRVPKNFFQAPVQPVDPQILKDSRLIAGFHDHPSSDTFRMLRAQVLRRLREVHANTLGVCSPSNGEGKTLVAANLAISLAMEPNYSVLLVDLDLRRSGVSRAFELDVKAGICDYLEENAEIADCLVNPGIERLTLFPVRRPIMNSSELLSSSRMVNLLDGLRSEDPNRIVIYDLPPVLTSDDSLVVLPKIQASLLVVGEGQTSVAATERSLDLLHGHNLIGTLLNNSVEDNAKPAH